MRAYAAFGVAVHEGLVWWKRGDSSALVVAELLDVAARELAGSVCLKAERRAAGDILPVGDSCRHGLRGASLCFADEGEADGGVRVGERVKVSMAADGSGEWDGSV